MTGFFRLPHFLLVLAVILPAAAYADGSFIDKIYHPYVQAQEKEFEIRGRQQSDDLDTYRIGYGQSLNDRWFSEIYLIDNELPSDNHKFAAIELEFLWQITEQGEYAADWGMLFELDHSFNDEVDEVATTVLTERQWGKWVGTANLRLVYEWGENIRSEIDTGLALQARYRYSRAVEPAIELYAGENSTGIGPVLLGNIRLDGKKQFNWEAGVIAGLNDDTPDTTFKFLIELEFY